VALRIVAGAAGEALGAAVAKALDTGPVAGVVERFPDGEVRPEVGDLGGDDVYVVQPTCPPVAENLVELVLLLDACRRAGAVRLTAVVAYFGYARQDRRGRPGQALGARAVADTLAVAGADRLVVVDPHVTALEAVIGLPTEIVSAVPVLADALAAGLAEGTVVVAPDLGAVHLAESYAAALGLEVAVVRKTRLSGAAVQAGDLIGDVEGRPVVVVDDMISTGATIEAAVDLVMARGAAPGIAVAATHGLLVGDAARRLGELPIRRLLVTDSCHPGDTSGLPIEVCTIAPVLATTIDRLHRPR
jgi:ribose-phosphate pyrophosphokinase